MGCRNVGANPVRLSISVTQLHATAGGVPHGVAAGGGVPAAAGLRGPGHLPAHLHQRPGPAHEGRLIVHPWEEPPSPNRSVLLRCAYVSDLMGFIDYTVSEFGKSVAPEDQPP